MDLSTLVLPRTLVPAIHQLMDVAETAFGFEQGPAKKVWVRESMLVMFDNVEEHRAPDWHAHPMASALLDVLIEALWSLHFASPKGPLARAMAGLPSRRLSRL